MENHHYLIWKINSHSIQAIVVLKKSEHMLNDWAFLPYFAGLRNLSEVSYLLTWALVWNPNFSLWNISYVLRRFKTVFGATILNR